VAFSPLVKTMLAGGDPNVGRIAGAVGASPARFDPQKLSIAIGGRAVVQNGVVCTLSAQAQRRLLKPKHVVVAVDLHTGQGRGSMLTCDLTHEYVRINAGYAT
jgi:glutamate N-acetyltransferase/amino-acid N-acetyltransferase